MSLCRGLGGGARGGRARGASAVRMAARAASSRKGTALVPVANGTEEMEAVILADVLRRAGMEVSVASVEADKAVRCSRQVTIVADEMRDEKLHARGADVASSFRSNKFKPTGPKKAKREGAPKGCKQPEGTPQGGGPRGPPPPPPGDQTSPPGPQGAQRGSGGLRAGSRRTSSPRLTGDPDPLCLLCAV